MARNPQLGCIELSPVKKYVCGISNNSILYLSKYDKNSSAYRMVNMSWPMPLTCLAMCLMFVYTYSIIDILMKCKSTVTTSGLVVIVPGYRSRGPGFDSRHCQIFREVVGLERGPLSLVRITEELLECLENRD
jgi:hypothetical protein